MTSSPQNVPSLSERGDTGAPAHSTGEGTREDRATQPFQSEVANPHLHCEDIRGL